VIAGNPKAGRTLLALGVITLLLAFLGVSIVAMQRRTAPPPHTSPRFRFEG